MTSESEPLPVGSPQLLQLASDWKGLRRLTPRRGSGYRDFRDFASMAGSLGFNASNRSDRSCLLRSLWWVGRKIKQEVLFQQRNATEPRERHWALFAVEIVDMALLDLLRFVQLVVDMGFELDPDAPCQPDWELVCDGTLPLEVVDRLNQLTGQRETDTGQTVTNLYMCAASIALLRHACDMTVDRMSNARGDRPGRIIFMECFDAELAKVVAQLQSLPGLLRSFDT